MDAKQESTGAAASSKDDAPGTKARGVPFGFGRRAWAQLGLIVALAIATIFALIQEPKPNPFAPVPSNVVGRAWQWVRYPVERNPHARLPVIPVDLRSVFFRRDSGIGWIMGASGYIARTDDGGRTWVRGRIETAGPAAPAKSSGLGGPVIAVAHAGEINERPLDTRLLAQAPSREPLQQQQQQAPSVDKNLGATTAPVTTDPKAAKLPAQEGKGADSPKKDPSPKPQPRPAPKAETKAPAPPPVDVTTADLRGIHFTDDRRGVAVGDGGTLLASDDGGRTWRARRSGTLTSFTAVAHDGRRWVAVGESGAIVTSENGTDWQARSSGTNAWLYSVAHDGRRWVIVGDDGAIITSENGTDWQARTSATQVRLLSVAHDGRRWVAVGEGSAIVSSENGTDWQARTIVTQARLTSVAHDGRRWVAVGDGGAIVTSENGTDWQARSSDTKVSLTSVAHDGRRWVAVGEGSAIVSSENGTDWQARSSGTKAWLSSVAHDGRRWVAAGQYGAIITSENGTDWQARSSGTNVWLYSVAHDGRRWVIVGDDGAIITSENGTDWQARTSATQVRLLSVAHDGRRWVAVGEGGVIVTSENGADWQAITYRRYVAGWYWLLCLALLGSVTLAHRIPEPNLRAQAPERTVADQAVSDAPVRSAAEDKLRFSLRVDGLSRYLRNKNTEPPLTLAINGAWGSGKSSFMRMLQADLERHGARTVWFNAWHLQKEEQLQAALLDAIRTQVPPPWWSPLGLEFRRRLFWKRTQAAPITALIGVMVASLSLTYLLRVPANKAETNGERLLVAVQCLLAPPQDSREDKLVAVAEKLVTVAEKLTPTTGGSVKPTTTSVSDGDKNVSKSAGINAKRCKDVLGEAVTDDWWRASWRSIFSGDLGYGLLILVVGLLPTLKALAALRAFGVDPAALKVTLAGLTSRKALSEETAVRARFTKEFSTVTEALAPRILTIFIDDLDRCNEKQLMETLEAVNYLAESGRCYVILGMVEETVQRLVGLAVERLAAELAEQEQQATGAQQSGNPAQLEEAKRERRRRFAERYLEKLINIKIDVPSLSADQAAVFVSQNKNKKNGEQLDMPGWIGGLDWVLKRARAVWLPMLLLFAVVASVYVASELAEDGKGEQPAAVQTVKQSGPPVAPTKGSTQSPDLPSPKRPERFAIVLPDLVAPVASGAGWMQWTGLAIAAGLLLLAFYFALIRRLDYNTNDSPAFSRALEIWSPLLLGKLRTPRGLKRFQNQLRFRAMALDAQAAPPLDRPVDLGPLGKWFADRAQAKLEAERRFNNLLPEPFLVGLEALRIVFPETGFERLSDSAALTTAIEMLELSAPESPAVDELTWALARHDREVQDGKWPAEYRWPPQDEHYQRYIESFELGPRTAENQSRTSDEARA